MIQADKQPATFPKLFEQYGARMTIEEGGKVLRLCDYDAKLMIREKVLVPLGKPARNAVKWFSTYTVAELSENTDWLSRMTKVCQQRGINRNKD